MDDYFTLVIHHGGRFIPGPPRKYEGGWVDHVDYIDPNRFNLTMIAGLLKDIGYAGVELCSYVLLGQNMDNELVMLITDDDAIEMVSKYKGQAEIDIYVEHPIDTPTMVDSEVEVLENESYIRSGSDDSEEVFWASNDDDSVAIDTPTVVDSEVEGLKHIFDNIYHQMDHRYYARHIWANLSKTHKGREYKDKFWSLTKVKTMWEFNDNMEELKKLNFKAWEYLAGIPPKFWTRAAFRIYLKNWNVTNNMCEQFNNVLVPFKGKPIITMLEEIRSYIAKRRIEYRQKMIKYQGPIIPSAQRKVELAKTHSRW
ncbi:hypothetical protein L6164_017241 [Bauhinia variegata]|uniref:Uncharacterized protein n=1 Tax=Bauhinia variegata TaxID=167791 RepID=A0ACB9N947_BAUVA|nr:hypothetical protein L6164_017241 [Bauhinia variegata]